MAQQILHGHYGINPGEPSSPSSSILWPFLLAPFSTLPLHRWVPFVFSFGFGLAECVLLGRLVDRTELLPARTPLPLRIVLAAALAISANLVGLTFLGMEHTLQVFLMTGCFWGLAEAYESRPVPIFCLWMAAIAPSVRYEDLAFTVAVVMACAFQRRWRASSLTLGASLAPLLLFSASLRHQGLPPLPSSVLVKGGMAGTHAGGALHNILLTAWQNMTT